MRWAILYTRNIYTIIYGLWETTSPTFYRFFFYQLIRFCTYKYDDKINLQWCEFSLKLLSSFSKRLFSSSINLSKNKNRYHRVTFIFNVHTLVHVNNNDKINKLVAHLWVSIKIKRFERCIVFTKSEFLH